MIHFRVVGLCTILWPECTLVTPVRDTKVETLYTSASLHMRCGTRGGAASGIERPSVQKPTFTISVRHYTRYDCVAASCLSLRSAQASRYACTLNTMPRRLLVGER